MGSQEINPNDYDTVCIECYFVKKNTATLTCTMCGGKVVWTPRGTSKNVVKEIKERGTTSAGYIQP